MDEILLDETKDGLMKEVGEEMEKDERKMDERTLI